jgi:hypothetical protein
MIFGSLTSIREPYIKLYRTDRSKMFDEKDFSIGKIHVLFLMALITALVIHLNSQKHSNLVFEYHLRIDLSLLWSYTLKRNCHTTEPFWVRQELRNLKWLFTWIHGRNLCYETFIRFVRWKKVVYRKYETWNPGIHNDLLKNRRKITSKHSSMLENPQKRYVKCVCVS